jgi:hypothetical protein
MQVIADRPHHDLAGIETDPNVQLQAVGAAYLFGIVPHRRLHGQAGVTGP